jgi:very-short-patch-repair endonuclease
MNEIEQKFYDEFQECEGDLLTELTPQVTIGKYRVDFVYNNCAIEIDGHEYHKTKSQRLYDYERERFLIKQGYVILRFTATEVYWDAKNCVREAVEIANDIHMREVEIWVSAYDHGSKGLDDINRNEERH